MTRVDPSPQDRPRVLFYCQHLLGVGHISRSLAICRALIKDCDVVFVQGGPDIGRSIEAPEFRHVFLPPLLMREHDSSLYDPSEQHSVETLWEMRGEALAPVMTERFDAVIVELFPFGRNKFKPEILGMIAAARAQNPAVQVFCSNRDIMVEKPDQEKRENKIVAILQEHFDCLLVHTDPALITLDQTVKAAPRLADMTRYTGYVAEAEPANAAPVAAPGKRILVSIGGGAIGHDMAKALIRVAPAFPDYEMKMLTGPYTPSAVLADFMAIAEGKPNVRIHGFVPNFRVELRQAAVSVSLAGYNTLMDLLATGVPALVAPYMANIEQNMRATELAKQGLLGILTPDDLQPVPLERAIRERLNAPPPAARIDLNGAPKTAAIVLEMVAAARATA